MIVELKVNDEIHTINTDKICCVSLGDGTFTCEIYVVEDELNRRYK